MNFGRLLLVIVVLFGPAPRALQANGPIDFARDVAPILQQHCIRCHQPANTKTQLSLATGSDLAENGYVIPGEPGESHFIEVVIAASGERPQMPKEGPPLSGEEVALLRAWIAEGATWPADFVVREKSKADHSWWALQPLTASEPSAEGIASAWQANPIDRFIYARLAENDLGLNPPAKRRTLIRRVSYDLTGLPPTPEEVDAFVNDDSPEAYEKLVDRLLASPRYGEHWGRHWLDVTRFGESTGFEVNHVIDNAWPFRDYVIESFNDDKPFSRLVIEHLAGDAIGSGDPAVEVGLTFLVCGPTDIVGNSDAEKAAQIRSDTVDEIIRATSEAFLGLTIGCARCHDHKFDPILQQDYYRLYAAFAGVYHDDRLVAPADQLRERGKKLDQLDAEKKALLEQRAAVEKLEKTPRPVPARDRERGYETASSGDDERIEKLDQQLAEIEQRIGNLPSYPLLRVGRFEQPAGPQHLFVGGDANRKGEVVQLASISTLAESAQQYTLPPDAPEQQRRLALARWIVAEDNPLTPRVLVNRLWHYHFGTGIVATPSDFGFMGDRPAHPELLDWLAQRLLAEGWRLKPLHKLLLMSETYRQSSEYRDDAARVDADGRLLWRFPPRRLAAEEIRDTMLLLAGQLDERMGGPGFRLYEYSRDNVATYMPLETIGVETYRRSIYHQNARASCVDVLTDFDAPDCAYSVSRRIPTTTPLQALALMNHSFAIDMADAFSVRLAGEAGDDNVAAQVERAFKLAYARNPDPAETAAATKIIKEHGLRAFCRAILNSNELIYID